MRVTSTTDGDIAFAEVIPTNCTVTGDVVLETRQPSITKESDTGELSFLSEVISRNDDFFLLDISEELRTLQSFERIEASCNDMCGSVNSV